MKSTARGIIFTILFFLCIEITALANIAPLKINSDGVEPLENPGVKIDSAEIIVSPEEDGFRFNCNYVLMGLQDGEDLTVGIPGDMGYTLEAGYIESMNVVINGKPVKHETYNTSKNLSQRWLDYKLPLNFKWHTFSVPVKKNITVKISVTYNISWRILEESSESPYYIVPFLLSTDRLFSEGVGSYKVKYMNDDHISIPDVKVMMNFLLEPNIISKAIMSPEWGPKEISWQFKESKDFQDFRLIVLSYRKLAMNFTTGSEIDDSIKWAVLNESFDKLAQTFEEIATKKLETDLKDEELGTASYLASEFYFRLGDYDKAIEMLSLPYKTDLWPIPVKYEYTNAVKLKEDQDYKQQLEVLEHLANYKDYILVSKFANDQIELAKDALVKQETEVKIDENIETPVKTSDEPIVHEDPLGGEDKVKNSQNLSIIIALSILALSAIGYGVYITIKNKYK